MSDDDDTFDRVAKELDHILRAPVPWRDRQLTECGLAVERCVVITADDLVKKIGRVGRQRAAFSTCMTCAGKVSTRRDTGQVVEPSLVDVLRRECSNYRRDDVLEIELRAIAELVKRHRPEFDGLVARLSEVTDLAVKRHEKATSRVKGKRG